MFADDIALLRVLFMQFDALSIDVFLCHGLKWFQAEEENKYCDLESDRGIEEMWTFNNALSNSSRIA